MRFFEQFKQLLTAAVSDAQFVQRNTLLQDAAYKADVLAHIAALTNDFVFFLTFADVASVDGGWTLDPTHRLVAYDVAASEETSIITFNARPLTVPIRLRDIGLNGSVPIATAADQPDTQIEYQLDGDGKWLGLRDVSTMGPVPDLIATTSVQLRIKVLLNGQPAQTGWAVNALTVFTGQE